MIDLWEMKLRSVVEEDRGKKEANEAVVTLDLTMNVNRCLESLHISTKKAGRK